MRSTLDHPSAAPLVSLSTAGLRVPSAAAGHVGDLRYLDLDSAASTPPSRAVVAAVTAAAAGYASVHRGAGWASQLSTAAYEQAKARIAHFVGARPDDLTIITRNTTDALTLLAGAVPGDVVHLDIEHHANLLPWRRGTYRVVRAGDSVAATFAALGAELATRPAALLTVTGASNVTGETLPLDLLADLAHRHGARLAVDGAQLVAHRPVDIAATGIDYLAFSGHKIYAPFGAGALIGRRDWLNAAAPHQPGGGAVDEVSLHDVRWSRGAARHEGGTPNVLGAIALAAACSEIDALGWDVVRAHESALARLLEDGLRDLGIEPLRLWGGDRVGIATFTVRGHDAADVAAYLAVEHGIGVRDGRFCAHPLLRRFGVDRAVRVSVGLGSSVRDVDALLTALRALIDAGPRPRTGAVGAPTSCRD